MPKPAANVGQDEQDQSELDSEVSVPDTDDTTGNEQETDNDGAQQADDAADDDAADSDSDTDVDSESDSDSPESDDDAEAEDTEPEEDLLTPEQRASAKGNPAKLEKLLHRAFTQKTQRLAAERRTLTQKAAVIDMLSGEHGDLILAELAAKRGMKLEKPAAASQQSIVDSALATLEANGLNKEALQKVLPLMQAVAQAAQATAIDPLNARLKAFEERAAKSEMDNTVALFRSKYPDFERYKPAMQKLIEAMPQGQGISTFEYLVNIYKLAKPAGIATRKAVGKTLKRMEAGARAAGANRSAGKGTSVSGTKGRVERTLSPNASIREMWEEAEREEGGRGGGR